MRADQMPRQPGSDCQECGMWCEPGEFHPYAACLMFKACSTAGTVRANLAFVREQGSAAERTAREAAEAEVARLRGRIERLGDELSEHSPYYAERVRGLLGGVGGDT